MYKRTSFKLFVILFFTFVCFFIFPEKVNAYIKVTDFISINDPLDYQVKNELSFIDGRFKIKEEFKLLGIEGKVKNDSDFNLPYIMKVEYYDQNELLICKAASTSKVLCDTEENFVNPIGIEGYIEESYKKIAKYRVAIFTSKNCDQYNNNLLISEMKNAYNLNDNGESQNDIAIPKDFKKLEMNHLPEEDQKKYDQYISKLNVDVNVTEDNVYEFTMDMKVKFNKPSNTFSWFIPLKVKLYRNDEQFDTRKVTAQDIKSSVNYKLIHHENKIEVLNEKLDGNFDEEQDIKIKYKINIGKDPLKNIDELYININENVIDMPIYNISFAVHMPSKFDPSTLMFSYGKFYIPNNDLVEYKVENNDIIGNFKTYFLNPNEKLTMRMILPEGYFVNSKIPTEYILITVIAIVFVVIVVSVIRKIKKS